MKIENIELVIPKKEIKLGDEKVQVKQYLPTKGKSDIMIAIKEFCFDTQILDQAKVDAVLNGLIILNYTDIEFEFEETRELVEFYDYLEINDYIVKIIEAIPEIEYNALIGYYKNTISDFNKIKVSPLATLMQAIEVVPELMEKISEISKEIDLEAIKVVADISSKMN